MYKPSGNHQFDKACLTLGIEHRLTKPRSPQTNGMVERFNGRIAELLKGRRFDSRAHLEELLQDYQRAYNHQIPQRALDHQTPIQTLKLWAESAPELFTKKVYDLSGLEKFSARLLKAALRLSVRCSSGTPPQRHKASFRPLDNAA